MRYLTLVLFAVCTLALTACPDINSQVVEDQDYAYQVWEEDKRPTLDDEAYGELTPEAREAYIPAALDRARRAFFEQAGKTARTAAGEKQEEPPPLENVRH